MPSSPTPPADRGPVGPGPDDKRLRAAARLAVEVAAEGERAEPRQPAPAELRPVLGFTRLSAASYRVIHRVIDDDGVFRARVAEAADEAQVGRVGWLWLHRPVGWLDDPALITEGDGPEPPDDRPAGTEREAVAKHRRAAKEADAARRRAVDELAEVRRELRRIEGQHRAASERADAADEARAAAVRAAKDAEAKLADARRDLKVSRRAHREVEAELAAARAQLEGGSRTARPDAPAAPVPVAPVAPVASVRAAPTFDAATAGAVGAEIAAAADAAAGLAEALARAAARLAPAEPAPEAPAPPPAARRRATRSPRSARASRPLPTLPPGTFDGTPEAHRHLIADRANLLVVDGYNLARTAWSGVAPEEERRRTVALLDDVQARSKGPVTVVFDGADEVVAPLASRRVRTRFSATGQTADDAIIELLDALPASTPAVVVSSDRAVVRDARARGAATMSSAEFLAAAGR